MVDCCMDMELKKVIVPKGVVGYSFDRYRVCLYDNVFVHRHVLYC